MTIEADIIVDLAVVMTIAAAITFVFERFKQPIVLGYIVAGVLIGPYTPPFSLVTNVEIWSVFAEIGVVLLLFAVGLEFPIGKLRKIGNVAGGVAAVEIVAMFGVAFLVGFFLKWQFVDIIFLAAALASSSTTIIAKVLADMGKIREVPASIMLGVLVVEDLVVVTLLSFLLSFGSAGGVEFETIALTLLKVGFFIGGLLVVGGWVVPRIVDRAESLGNHELFLIGVLGLCFASGVLALKLGLSVAIGAFLMGVLIAGSKSVEHIRHDVISLKDMFGALFFTSMGALIDISQFRVFIVPAIIITVGLIAAKTLGVGFATRSFGYNRDVSIKVALGMSQIGEFAFIVIKAGQDLNAVSSFLLPTVGVAVGITTFLTPYLTRIGYSRRW